MWQEICLKQLGLPFMNCFNRGNGTEFKSPLVPRKPLKSDNKKHSNKDDSCSITSGTTTSVRSFKSKTNVASAPNFRSAEYAQKRKEMPGKISTGRKEKSEKRTRKRTKPSSTTAVPSIEAINDAHFEKEVVEWMTKEEKLQVMHFSNEISKTLLKGKPKTTTLINIQTQKRYKCRLITAERASYEKYLGGGWFNFCRDRMLEMGEKLIFHIEKPPKNMHVC